MQLISSSLSPNAEQDDVKLAAKVLVQPWVWRDGEAIKAVERWFMKYFSVSDAVSFNSGRSALLALLHAFGIGNGDEVLLQAFTCVAVPNSVLWAGATPVYVDIDETLNIDIEDVQKKITPKTRAIIVQHTLGIPASMDRIVAFAKQNKLILIEDCAHALGATHKGRKVGTFGDGAFFSFGRDKVVSSVFGGMAVIAPKHKTAKQSLRVFHSELKEPSLFWIFQQLLHPIAFWIILPVYTLGFGKLVLYMLQRLRLLSFPVYPEEKKGKQPTVFPQKYPNALAILLLRQLSKLERFNARRIDRARQYLSSFTKSTQTRTVSKKEDDGIFLRFPVLVDNPEDTSSQAKKNNILLGNWYHNVIDPTGVNFEAVGYRRGTCPKAEEASQHIVNLPTNISEEAATRVIGVV